MRNNFKIFFALDKQKRNGQVYTTFHKYRDNEQDFYALMLWSPTFAMSERTTF